MPRRPKVPTEQDSALSKRVKNEPPAEPPAPESSGEATWIATDPAAPAEVSRPAPEPRPSGRPAPESRSRNTPPAPREAGPGGRIPIVAVVTVLLVLAFGSMASAGLLQGKGVWAEVLFLATASLLGASILGVWNRDQARRAFWQGFAVFGLGYLALAFAPWPAHQMRVELPTSRWIVSLHARAATISEDARTPAPIEKAEPGLVSESPKPATTNPGGGPPKAASSSFVAGNLEQFLVVGHCLIALAAALMGSGIARWFDRTNFEPA